MNKLEENRAVINDVDREMALLFVRRFAAVQEIAQYKLEQGLPVLDRSREEALIAEKETLIDRINELDSGFQSVYDRIKDEVQKNKSSYIEEIKTLQELITKLTDKGVEIQTSEERNRARIEKVLMGAKKEIRKSRKSMQAVSNYYKSMSAPNLDISGTVDKKK